MPVTLPEGVDTSKTHKIFLVFTSTGSTAKYVANVRDLTGVKSSTALARESVDISNGMTAGTEYNTMVHMVQLSHLKMQQFMYLQNLTRLKLLLQSAVLNISSLFRLQQQQIQRVRFLETEQQHMYSVLRLTAQLHYTVELLLRYGISLNHLTELM